MIHRGFVVSSLLLIVVAVSPPARAQSAALDTACPPVTTFARNSLLNLNTPSVDEGHIIAEIRFEGDVNLPQSELERISSDLLSDITESRAEGNVDELAYMAKFQWEERGYFLAKVAATVEHLTHDPTATRDVVIFHVEAGPLFRVRKIEIQVKSANDQEPVAAPESVRALLSLKEGDRYDSSKIDDFKAKVLRFYRAQGHPDLNTTISTSVDSDDKSRLLDLFISFDVGRQFRVASVEVVGLDAQTQSELRAMLPLGEPYNLTAVSDYLEQISYRLPVSPDDVDVLLDRKDHLGTVGVRIGIDLRAACWRLPTHGVGHGRTWYSASP